VLRSCAHAEDTLVHEEPREREVQQHVQERVDSQLTLVAVPRAPSSRFKATRR